jgi:fermentation-respiration switch protein FrsA (DUF1100 family)
MIQKRPVNFYSEGYRIAADLFLPSDFETGQKRPGVVLCHGFTGVRQLMLEDYAQVFAEAGYVSLIFDYRGFRSNRSTIYAMQSLGWKRSPKWTRKNSGFGAPVLEALTRHTWLPSMRG